MKDMCEDVEGAEFGCAGEVRMARMQPLPLLYFKAIRSHFRGSSEGVSIL